LKETESYGRSIGSWSLQVDALMVRAERMMDFGETTTAGRLLGRAMATAWRNRMMLRLNKAMTLYAAVLDQRRDRVGALRHAENSVRISGQLGYAIETVRAQRLISKIETGLDRGKQHPG
jgi:hypothetical protein